jgi:peptide/nickel transport system ATP-binding protein
MVFDPLHPYSKGLMGSILVPEKGARDTKLTAIPGTPPNLKNPPKGCRFADRCRYAKPACMLHPIAESRLEDGRMYRCYLEEKELREVYQDE